MIFAIIIITGIALAMFMEYALHLYYLHATGKHPHITKHHVMFNGNKSFSISTSKYSSIVSNPSYIATQLIPHLLIIILFKPISTSHSSIFLISGFTYAIWVEYAHYMMHHPTNHFIEGTSFFKTLFEHHRLHHVYFTKNYGIGSRVMDRLFNTLKA